MTVEHETMHCARHPSVETVLRCGRCETPICPRCAVFTDVGARCPDCAPRKKLPQFEVGPVWGLRAAAAAGVSGAVIGGLWGALLPGGFGFLMIFFGIGIGWAISEAVSLATNRKSGPVLQTIAVLGVLLAFLVRNLVADYGLLAENDFGGLIALVAATVMAINRLKI